MGGRQECYLLSIFPVIFIHPLTKILTLLLFPRERLSKHYIYLLQRIQQIASRQYCNTAIVIIDNANRRIDKWAAYAFNNYLYRTEDGNRLDCILEVPIFADSEMTMGIQLADLVAGLLRQYYRHGLHRSGDAWDDDLYFKKLREYHDIIASRSPNFGAMYGLYVAPDDFLSRYYR